MKNYENRIDWKACAIKEEIIRNKRADLIYDIEECAIALHDAHLGNDFDRDALLKSEEFLMMYAGFLRGLN